jgi:hypothetical protein
MLDQMSYDDRQQKERLIPHAFEVCHLVKHSGTAFL